MSSKPPKIPVSLFESPFRPDRSSRRSPTPEPSGSSEKESWSPKSPDSNTGSDTPLMGPSPVGLEKGQGAYPFPIASRSSSLLAHLSGGRSHRNGWFRKWIWLILAAMVLMVVAQSRRRSPTTLISPDRLDTPSQSPAVDDPAFGVTDSRSWSLPLFPFKSPSVSSPPSFTIQEDPKGGRAIDIASDPLPVEATLRERLEVWRNAPGGRGEVEGEIELGGFNSWNLEQCETISEQHNTHMIQKSANVWGAMNRSSLHENRMLLINHMENVLEQGLIEQYGEGRGIVMVAGNADTLRRVKWSLQMMRRNGSTLPVQIWCFPSELPQKDDPIHQELRELGAVMVAADGYAKDKGKNKSYHLKAIAVVQSPWREVLYLDSDSIPARDPEYMFEAPNYKRLGLWATPDYWKTSSNNPIWAIIGVKCRNEWEMETGQMFIDKKLHLDVFLLIQYMLENHDWWFYFSDGDKDIFRWAMLALRKRWGVPGRWVGAGGLPYGTASGDFCGHTMLQHDSWGEPLFVHYNLLKQIPSGVGRGYSWGRTKRLPLFNLWPGTPATNRLGEGSEPPKDDDERGLGDVDCDMVADADEYGRARSPGKEMVMRRAARERGVKVRYHGGSYSALCIDFDYVDPRPQDRQDADNELKELEEKAKRMREEDWMRRVDVAKARNQTLPVWEDEVILPIRPDWGQSPIEIAQWGDDPVLNHFENDIYDLGFVPGGPGF